MRVLLDECLPRRLKRELIGHDALTVPEVGWAGKRNGELLRLAERDFDAFLTADRRLRFEQRVSAFRIVVIVLAAHSNSLLAMRPLVAKVLEALPEAKPGDVIVIGQ